MIKEVPESITVFPEMTVLKLGLRGKYISVEIRPSGDLTLSPFGKGSDRGFIFMSSTPEMVKTIGELLIKAAEIGEKAKKGVA